MADEIKTTGGMIAQTPFTDSVMFGILCSKLVEKGVLTTEDLKSIYATGAQVTQMMAQSFEKGMAETSAKPGKPE